MTHLLHYQNDWSLHLAITVMPVFFSRFSPSSFPLVIKLSTPGFTQTWGYPILNPLVGSKEQSSQLSAGASWALRLSLLQWPPGGSDSPVAAAIPHLREWRRGWSWGGTAHSWEAAGRFHLKPMKALVHLPPYEEKMFGELGLASLYSLHSGVSLFPSILPHCD